MPEEFRNRIVRDVILKHRKPEAYRKDIGPDRHDPYGAYSRVELLDSASQEWVGWRDPKGYSADKFAEPRPASDPENEVLHDWIATVGPVRAEAVRVTNVGKNPDYSVLSVHGVEVVFFPEANKIQFVDQIYCEGTEFIDLEEGKLLPKYGGGSHTEGIYEGAVTLRGDFFVDLEPDRKLLQVEIAAGDTEHLDYVNPKTGRQTRLGYAKLSVGILRASGQTEWFVERANVPPQGVISGAPFLEKSLINPGDRLVIRSEDDTSYLMGWRIGYEKEEEVEQAA